MNGRTAIARPRWEEEGPLLPPGWRPDREAPAEDHDGPARIVVDPAGHLRLGNDIDVALRPFRPVDVALLVSGFNRLSEQSRYRRFLAPIPRLTDSLLAFLTAVDGVDHSAWAAVVDEPDGPVGAGIVRWVRTSDPAVADMAVTVIDDYQGRGLGGLLLDVAVLDAIAHGITRFEGLVLGENIVSRRMLVRAGARLRPDGGGVLAFTLPLAPRAERMAGSALPGVVAVQSRRAGLAA